MFKIPRFLRIRRGNSTHNLAAHRLVRDRKLRVETLECRALLSANPWHNSQLSADVNQDGSVSPSDVLEIIEQLNQSGGARSLAYTQLPPTDFAEGEDECTVEHRHMFVDVNADGYLTSSDALEALNAIGEGESIPRPDNLASIRGISFTDVTNDGLTADDPRSAGATINLYLDDGDSILSPADIFLDSQTSASDGSYRFDNLSSGNYLVEQEPITGLFQAAGSSVQFVSISALQASGQLGTTIDTFDLTEQTTTASAIGDRTASSALTAQEAIGGERDLAVELTSLLGEAELSVNSFGNLLLQFDTSATAFANRLITWDGPDGNGEMLDPTGLGGVDLTDGGENIGIMMDLGADLAGGTAILRVYSDGTNWSQASFSIPVTGGQATETIVIPFNEFMIADGTGADLTQVGAVELSIEGAAAVDGQIDLVAALRPTVLQANFPNLPPLSLGNVVWHDADNDGMFDAAVEDTFSDVLVNLYSDTDSNDFFAPGVDTFLQSEQTDASGNYLFTGLEAGDYIVQVDPMNFTVGQVLAGFSSSNMNIPTPDPDDDVDNDDNGDPFAGQGVSSRAITLAVGTEPVSEDGDSNSNLTVDFGFFEPADSSIAGFVYLDLNDDGIFDSSELGIPGVEVILTGQTLSGDLIEITQITDSNGGYLFDQLRPGIYTVSEIQPQPFPDGKDTPGTPLLGQVRDDVFENLELDGNIDAVDYNFGELLPSKRETLASNN